MTLEALRDVGVVVEEVGESCWQVEPGPIGGLDVQVEPDLSNAGPFLAAAAVTGGRVRVPGGRSTRPRPATRCATCSTRWAPTSPGPGRPDRGRHR
jgi:5-enolpyruvylshikimate-3-phosphate synthase